MLVPLCVQSIVLAKNSSLGSETDSVDISKLDGRFCPFHEFWYEDLIELDEVSTFVGKNGVRVIKLHKITNSQSTKLSRQQFLIFLVNSYDFVVFMLI